MNVLEILSHTRFFEGVSPKSLRRLAEICGPTRIERQAFLFHEGQKGSTLYILVSGSIRLHRTAPDGKQVVIKVVSPGELFAEVILFERERYPVTAEALQDSLLYALDRGRFHALLELPDFRDDFIGMLMRKQRYLVSRVQMLAASDVEQRLFVFLREHHGEQEEIRTDLSKKEVAGAIGSTPETLSRLLLRLKKSGRLRWEGRSIRLAAGFWDGWQASD